METYNLIIGLVTMLIFVYALVIIPRALGEIKGIYMETPDEFYGKFKSDCMWTHGTTYAVGILAYIIAIPILLIIWEQTLNHFGITVAAIVVIIILIPFKLYYDKQKPINAQKAYQKNIEDGYLKETDPMPNEDGLFTKIYKKITKKS